MAEKNGHPAPKKNLLGDEIVKTNEAENLAIKEGRLGYAALMEAKAALYDIPVHLFSPGDSPKALATPSVKDAPQKSK